MVTELCCGLCDAQPSGRQVQVRLAHLLLPTHLVQIRIHLEATLKPAIRSGPNRLGAWPQPLERRRAAHRLGTELLRVYLELLRHLHLGRRQVHRHSVSVLMLSRAYD